jgi:hypothetical protein
MIWDFMFHKRKSFIKHRPPWAENIDGMKNDNKRFGWATILVFLVLLTAIVLTAWYCYQHR